MAFLAKVHASGEFTFTPSTDREADMTLLQKGVFMQYVQTRHPLPPHLRQRLERLQRYSGFPGRLFWFLLCICCCDSRSWDMDRDVDELRLHIRGQLTGILEQGQYELLEHINIGVPWADGRPVLKLWLKDPTRYEA